MERVAAFVAHARLWLAAARRGSSSSTLQLQRQRGEVGERLQRRAVVDERHMVEQPQQQHASADHSLALAGAGSRLIFRLRLRFRFRLGSRSRSRSDMS